MVLSKVFIHLVFQGSSEDECQSVEASHNRVIAASQASPYPTLSPPVATTVATAGPSAPTSLGKSPTLDDNKSQLSREQCGGETAKKKEGEREKADNYIIHMYILYPIYVIKRLSNSVFEGEEFVILLGAWDFLCFPSSNLPVFTQ